MWATDSGDTEVRVERVIMYWSQVSKATEQNYSPTEREALMLNGRFIKFQKYLEGSQIFAITNTADGPSMDFLQSLY